MSNARYLELDSRFRNREEWPHPGEFEVPMSQTGTKNHMTALDPVSEASDLSSWRSGTFSLISSYPTSMNLSVAVESTIPAPSLGLSGDAVVVIMTSRCGALHLEPDFYTKAVMQSRTDPTSRVRISAYEFLGTDGVKDRGRFTLEGTLAAVTTPGPGNVFNVYDPTDVETPNVNPYIFIPGWALGENILVNKVIYNITHNESRPLGVFDRATSTVKIITTGSSVHTPLQGPIMGGLTAWSNNDTYSIRKTTPILQIQLNGDPANNPSTKTAFNFPSPQPYPTDTLIGSFLEYLAPPDNGPIYYTSTAATTTTITSGGGFPSAPGPSTSLGLDDFYKGASIRIISGPALGEIREIIRYNIVTDTFTVSPAFSAAPTSTFHIIYPHKDNYMFKINEARKITKWVNYTDTAIGGSTTTVNFPASASDINGYYSNLYIVPTSGPASGDIRLISTYVVTIDPVTGLVTSRIATVYTNFTGLGVSNGDTFSITSGNTLPFNSSISQAMGGTVPQNFALLPFTKDNFTPFSYTGSLVSQQDMVCYQIELLDLVLPNTILGTAYGSLISFYQYIYVELQNVSGAGSGLSNIIYSNNPNSTKMLFRCPIKDVPNPVNSTFIKINGNGMSQTIKFKPNDNIKFSVHMATGELFQTQTVEIFGPNEPDPITQISACFKMTRI
jgi:hypothetical protein